MSNELGVAFQAGFKKEAVESNSGLTGALGSVMPEGTLGAVGETLKDAPSDAVGGLSGAVAQNVEGNNLTGALGDAAGLAGQVTENPEAANAFAGSMISGTAENLGDMAYQAADVTGDVLEDSGEGLNFATGDKSNGMTMGDLNMNNISDAAGYTINQGLDALGE